MGNGGIRPKGGGSRDLYEPIGLLFRSVGNRDSWNVLGLFISDCAKN